MKIRFMATLKRFDSMGEKTGWTYIEVPAGLAQQLHPSDKKSFRVKGKLDHHNFSGVNLIPMGGGDYILAVNATMRKAIKKQKGAKVDVQMEKDTAELKPPAELMESLKDEPKALERFNSIAKSHQHYFTNWINSAKTIPTKAKRIAAAINALERGWDFGQMLRAQKKDRID
jgi:hypothetical protein